MTDAVREDSDASRAWARRWAFAAVGLPVVAVVYAVSAVEESSNQVAAVISQIAFLLPFVLAVLGSLRSRAASVDVLERAFWLRLAIASGAMLASETYVSVKVVANGHVDPMAAFVTAPLSVVAAVALLVLSGSMMRAHDRRLLAPARWILDVLVVVAVLIAANLQFYVRPYFSAWGVTDPVISIVAAVIVVIGMLMAGSIAANMLGLRRSRWLSWERWVAAGILVYAMPLVLWPVWYGLDTQPLTQPYARLLDGFWLVGMYHLYLATVQRRAPDAVAWQVSPVPVVSHRTTELARAAFPAIALTTVPGLWWLGLQETRGSMDSSVYFACAGVIVVLIAIRTVIVATEIDELTERAVSDPLTGFAGHGRFHEVLDGELRVAQREGWPVALAIIDLDGFWRINDVYGHQAGDRVLAQAGAAIASEAGELDTLCRVGGDEFAVIMPRCSQHEAALFGDRVRSAFARVGGPASSKLTASVGIAVSPDHGVARDELLKRAEGATYWAKQHGRDRVVVFDEDVVTTLDAEERLAELESEVHLSTIRALAGAVDARDAATQFHSRTVSLLAALVAEELGMDANRVEQIATAALLHDIGKIGVSDAVLQSSGRMNPEDTPELRDHPVLGAQILAATTLRTIAPWVMAHHEQWDGSGYPGGLSGENIPLEARIIAVCDAYEAMTSSRPWRPAMSRVAALQELDFGIGSRFDPDVAQALMAVLGRPGVTV